jgi:hypothetical protein
MLSDFSYNFEGALCLVPAFDKERECRLLITLNPELRINFLTTYLNS